MESRVLTLCHLATRYDDLLEEENEAVQIALKRLSAKEAYERVYRIRRSVQCSYTHKLLPKDQWTKPEEVRLLSCFEYCLEKALGASPD